MNGWLLLVLAASTAASQPGTAPSAPNANLEKENVILKSFVSLIRSKLHELDENLEILKILNLEISKIGSSIDTQTDEEELPSEDAGGLVIIGGDPDRMSMLVWDAGTGRVCAGPELPDRRKGHTAGQAAGPRCNDCVLYFILTKICCPFLLQTC